MPERGRRAKYLLALLMVVLLAGCGTAEAAGASAPTGKTAPIAMNIGVVQSNAVLQAVVAQHQRIFRQLGVNATINVLNIAVLPQTLGKQYDIGSCPQPIFLGAVNQGIPLVAIGGGALDTPADPQGIIVAAPGSSIRSIKQLKGKNFGVQALAGNTTLASKALFAKDGLNPDSVNYVLVQQAQMLAQLKAGNVDAAIIYQPLANQVIKAGGRVIGTPFATILPHSTASVWCAAKSWASAHKTEVATFQKAITMADSFIAKNPKQAKADLAAFTNLPKALVSAAPLPAYRAAATNADLSPYLPLMEQFAGLKPTSAISNINALIVSAHK